MTIKGTVCTSCGDKLYSRCKQDVQECHCGRTTISGDPNSPTVAINGNDLVLPELIDIVVQADLDVLFWDWNLHTNLFGVISEIEENEARTYAIEL